jgi:hypothetical protein
MKNLVCPVSSEKIPPNVPRFTAFLVTSLFGLFLYTGYLPIVILLMYDFFVRGYNYSAMSPLFQIARVLVRYFGKPGREIDKAPKLFAARLGFLISTLILLIAALKLTQLTNAITFVILTFSVLEWAFNICVGCLIYTWMVLPFSRISQSSKKQGFSFENPNH